jgi:hypothetical protein
MKIIQILFFEEKSFWGKILFGKSHLVNGRFGEKSFWEKLFLGKDVEPPQRQRCI